VDLGRVMSARVAHALCDHLFKEYALRGIAGPSQVWTARSDSPSPYLCFTTDPRLDMHVGPGFHRYGCVYDVHVNLVLQRIQAESSNVKDGRLVLDIGANLGSLALFAGSLGLPTVAAEIQWDIAALLRSSAYANSFETHVQVQRIAAGPEDGDVIRHGHSPGNPGGIGVFGLSPEERSKLTDQDLELGSFVKTVKLDTLIAQQQLPNNEPVLFVKVDVEGGELGVLNGALDSIRSKRIRNFVVEMWSHAPMKLLYQHGYVCVNVRTDRVDHLLKTDLANLFRSHDFFRVVSDGAWDKVDANIQKFRFLDFWCRPQAIGAS
jgi:FkbM family methyltransferase